MSTVLFVGDDYSIQVTLGTLDENSNFTFSPISLAATVNAALVSSGGTIIIPSTAQSNASLGADWPNGVVEVIFDNSLTGSLVPNTLCFMEVEVESGGVISTFQSEVDIVIKRSYIS